METAARETATLNPPVPIPDLRVPVTRMSEIVNGRRSITADTALRLARYFAMTPQFRMNLQASYDLDVATHASADRIKREVHPREAA